MLSEKDNSLAHAARNAPIPKIEKRKSSSTSGGATKKRKSAASNAGEGTGGKKRSSDGGKNSANAGSSSTTTSKSQKSELAIREVRGMENLATFIEEQKGGNRDMIAKYRCRVTIKPSDGRYDVNFFNEHGKRFRSMLEVGRFLNLIDEKSGSSASRRSAAAAAGIGNLKKKRKRGIDPSSSANLKKVEAEKKRLRKELDRLRKQYGRASKSLDAFLEDDKDAQYPVDDSVLQEEEAAAAADAEKSEVSTAISTILPTNCPAARKPDIDSFSGLPKYCMPEALQAWDFLCTFSRALSLQPISWDDFFLCLTYVPPPKAIESDSYKAPPVYLGEAHLGLLKLILTDPSSDEWWWSILETEETENAVLAHKGPTQDAAAKEEESDLPLIRINFAALLAYPEDPLMTNSWLRALQPIRKMESADVATMKKVLDEGIKLVANKWVLAFFRKAVKLGKTSGSSFMKQAILWLLDKVTEAKPELLQNTKASEILEKRTKVVEEVEQQMEKLSSATLEVNEEDLASDAEDDEEDDDSDDESQPENQSSDQHNNSLEEKIGDDQPASYVPKKPPPTLVDLMLPPGKPIPSQNAELFSPSSWPCMTGAATCRIVHRYKRLRNEVDDSLRRSSDLPQLTVKERRERESISSDRVLSEFVHNDGNNGSIDHAIEILCSGDDYLKLTPFERLAVLRILIEAAYDTRRVYEVVSSNHSQRTNAMKALDVEQRRAKREAKEKASADVALARQDLAMEARNNFLEEKREEIRKLNENNHELTAEDIDTLTEQDILDFDEDIKADFDALPTPESFKKAEVVERVAKIQESSAFETELLIVLSMEELIEREKRNLEVMEEDLKELGREDALMDPSLDRYVVRRIEKMRRDIRKAHESAEDLPETRAEAIENLKEAMVDGTIKSLRGAIRTAKSAKLFGPDEETNGVWALDVVRDAHMELENAKQLKRVADAQKDLVSKLNKCFIRTEPLGYDRFRNRFWRFEGGSRSHVWTEVNFVLEGSTPKMSNEQGYIEIVSDPTKVFVGPSDFEEDFTPNDEIQSKSEFHLFGSQEYHSSGTRASLAKRNWGCHINESSIRALMKGLDSRGIRENNLKKSLKEALEENATSGEVAAENKEQPKQAAAIIKQEEGNNTEDMIDTAKEGNEEQEMKDAAKIKQEEGNEDQEMVDTIKPDQTSGDETVFSDTKATALNSLTDDSDSTEIVRSIGPSAIGENVRLRNVIDSNREGDICRYEVASIISWKLRKDQVPAGDESEFEPQLQTVSVPTWQARAENGTEVWLDGPDLIESICRFHRWKRKDPDYFEHDAAFLAFRNNLGRHCGKAADAAHAMTPIRFGQYMVKCEAELYQRLKVLAYDNNWGGKNGSRNTWITSMREYSFDFETAKNGLLTLENAFFELIGAEFSDDANGNPTLSAKELLNNPETREDIELESIETGVTSLWNSKATRDVFLEIVASKLNGLNLFEKHISIGCTVYSLMEILQILLCLYNFEDIKSINFLTLALELLCRNTRIYLAASGVKGAPATSSIQSGYEQYAPLPMRTTRRMNAWQQSLDSEWEPQPRLGSVRSTRRSNVNYCED